MGHELAGSCAGRSDAETVNDVVQTALKEDDEVLTLLTAHTGSLVVGVVELTLEDAVHILDLLLLLELHGVVLGLLALCSETMLSRREISLLEIFV